MLSDFLHSDRTFCYFLLLYNFVNDGQADSSKIIDFLKRERNFQRGRDRSKKEREKGWVIMSTVLLVLLDFRALLANVEVNQIDEKKCRKVSLGLNAQYDRHSDQLNWQKSMSSQTWTWNNPKNLFSLSSCQRCFCPGDRFNSARLCVIMHNLRHTSNRDISYTLAAIKP